MDITNIANPQLKGSELPFSLDLCGQQTSRVLDEVHDLIDRIEGVLEGKAHAVQDCDAPPPHLDIVQQMLANKNSSEGARNRLVAVLEVLSGPMPAVGR